MSQVEEGITMPLQALHKSIVPTPDLNSTNEEDSNI